MKHGSICPIAAGVLLAITSSPAGAVSDVFRFVGYGPVSGAMGGAATAFDVGAAGMMTNPATLSMLPEGQQFHLGTDVILGDLSMTNTATGEVARSHNRSKNRGPFVIPHLAYTYRSGPLALGVGVFAHGGAGTEYGTSSFLSRASGGIDTGLRNSSRLMTLNIPFAASYQVNDKLAVGASLDAIWQSLNLDLLLGADQVGSLIGAGRVDGSLLPVLGGLPDLRGAHLGFARNHPVLNAADAWGIGGRIGMTYKVSKDTVVGAAYSMKSHVDDMKGGAALTAVDAVVGQIPLTGQVSIRDFQTPGQLNLGVSHRFNEQWMIAADISRIFWKDAMKDIDVGFVADNGANIDILLPLDFKDQTALSLGAAYQTGKWTLRGGARFTTQALRPETMLAVTPAFTTTFGSAGFAYEVSSTSKVDFAWTHAFNKEMDNSSLPNTSAPIRGAHAQDSISLAYTYRF